MNRNIDLVIIGGGPAGLAVAIAAKKKGIDDLIILEREPFLGGILNQCVHTGFGLHAFKKELSGPEYAELFIDEAEKLKIPCETDTTVVDISPGKKVTAVSVKRGLAEYDAKAVVIATGCRERPRGAINIAGGRAAGVYSAGTAQKYVNIMGYTIGKSVVILGSGDIGLIMARRMKFEGAEVKAVVELMPYTNGLNRNVVQCLEDYNIPLLLSHTVVDIKAHERVEGVTIAEVDKNLNPIAGTEKYIECDTLLLSVGLIPENELGKKAGISLSPATGGAIVDNRLMTTVPGVFSAGNALHVHDVVDFVSEEAAEAGESAAEYIKCAECPSEKDMVKIKCGPGVRYTVPQFIDRSSRSPVTIKFRVSAPMQNAAVNLFGKDWKILSKKKRIMTVGEMEKLTLDVSKINSLPDEITLSAEAVK
jgi:Thioredoxin reductase